MTTTTLVARLSAFGCGAVVATVLIASRQEVIAASSKTIHTCATADGTLRVADAAMPCQPEERRVRIQIPDKEDPECKADDARTEKLEKRLKDLEGRDKAGTLRGRRVIAPFDVVTEKGATLLHIDEEETTLYNRGQKPVVWIIADESGGMLHTMAIDRSRISSVIAKDKIAQLVIREKDQDHIDLGRRANGRYGLQVFGASNKIVGYLGQSEAGTGLATIADSAGTFKTTMYIQSPGGEGRLQVANAAGTVVGVMQASGRGSSPFQLSDATGKAMVEAGLMENGAGVVRAGPEFRGFGVGIVGLVPSMIMGKP